MKQRLKTSCFLQKFQGKLNIITKNGEIKDQSSFKLPAINSPQPKRSNSMKFMDSISSKFEFFLQGKRNIFIKSKDLAFLDISNNLMKYSCQQNLKKSRIGRQYIEPLSAILFTTNYNLELQQRKKTHQQNRSVNKNEIHHGKNLDYKNFLNELNSVSQIRKTKKSSSSLINR